MRTALLFLFFSLLAANSAEAQFRFLRGSASQRNSIPVTLLSGQPYLDTNATATNFWMGNGTTNKLIGGDSVTYGAVLYGTDAQASDAYVVTLAPTPGQLFNGMTVTFRAATANTGSATLNVNSLGAKTIYKGATSADTLATGDIAAGQVVTVRYADSAWFFQGAPETGASVRYISVPAVGIGATGTDWMGAAYNQNFFPFTVTERFTPDSSVWYLQSANATSDSFKVAIYSLARAKLAETAWGAHGLSSSNVRYAQVFTSHPVLAPGTYLFMYSHNTNTTLPSLDIMNTTTYFRVAQSKGWAGTVAATATPGGPAFPSTITGDVALAKTTVPIVELIGQ